MLFDHKLAWSDEKIYEKIYENSIQNPNGFWKHHSQSITWIKEPSKIFNDKTKSWLEGGIANVCYNCLDRHAKSNPDKVAIVWYGDEKNVRKEITYKELLKRVIEISSLLKSKNIKKGDVVSIYMPMVIDAIATMLACARIGVIHLNVFAGFAPNALAYRLFMSNAKILITQSSMQRGGKVIDLENNCLKAIQNIEHKPELIVLDKEKTFNEIELSNEIVPYGNHDNLFVLYTSGSTGKPKGIIHSALPYMLYSATTFKIIFDIKPDDVYFCTSDIGWITGHSYVAYAPLFHGLTIVLFEGSPIYPEANRYWEIIEKEKVSIFYTAPTAIRSLQTFGDKPVLKHDLSSLRILGSVGEPIDKIAWDWYFNIVGKKNCPIVDTWWQTETGGIMIAPLLNLQNQKPCVAGKPFFGTVPKIISPDSQIIDSPNEIGKLVIENSWPGMCQSVLYECEYSEKMPANGQSCRNIFNEQYFNNGRFITGDGALYDSDFDIKIVGRLDDVINISGHRLSTAEFEDAVLKTDSIIDCAVVAVQHNIKGQAAFVFAIKNQDESEEEAIKKILLSLRENIGAIAKPDYIAFVDDLPKTRSGKIVRYLLRDIAMQREININKTSESIFNKDIIPSLTEAVKKCYRCPDLGKLK